MVQWRRLGAAAAFGSALLAMAACSGDGGRESATPAIPGVDLEGKVLRIGALNDESGPAAVVGIPYAIGKRLLAKHVNAGDSGLLPAGWTLELVERDHGYNPQRSVQLFNEIRDEVLFIGTSFGTPNTLPLRPLLQRHGLVAFPASLSSKMAEFRYTPPGGPSYQVEAMRAFDWAVEHAGGKDQIRPGILYQHDDYGKDGLQAWRRAAEHHGVEIVAEQANAPGQADFTAAINALKKAGATHVLLTVLPSATGPALGTAAQLDYAPIWIGNTPSWIDRFFDPEVIPPSVFDNYYWVMGSPYWGEDTPFAREFEALYEQYGRDMAPPDFYMMTSYLQGRIALDVFSRALAAGDPSREGFMQALTTLEDYDAGGAVPFKLDFTDMPYVVGVEARVLKPLMDQASWREVAPFAQPQALQATPNAQP